MFIKFKDRCIDKYTGKMYRTNDIHEFDDERAKEIIASGYAVAVEPEEKVQDVTTVEFELPEENNTDEAMECLTAKKKSELVEMCKNLNIPSTGSKAELIIRLYDYYPF